jgi:hypothetical protein
MRFRRFSVGRNEENNNNNNNNTQIRICSFIVNPKNIEG